MNTLNHEPLIQETSALRASKRERWQAYERTLADTKQRLKAEAAKYGDIIFLPDFVDIYRLVDVDEFLWFDPFLLLAC